MKLNNIALMGIAVAAAAMLSGCGIYKKYETPVDTPITKAYAEALQQPVDSAAFGNLDWRTVFTDLRNAQLNVEVAQANVLGAKLAYLPSVALAPNGAGSSAAGSDLSWSYQLPAQLSWEVDIFGKLLNSKRGAQAALLRS